MLQHSHAGLKVIDTMIEIKEALELIERELVPLPTINCELANCVGRTLADDVRADVDSPPHTKSIMDGFAVRAEDVTARKPLKIIETIVAGAVPSKAVEPGTCARIMTGAPLPDGADSIVMVERVKVIEEAGCEFAKLEIDMLPTGQHAMQKAASFANGETIFQAGHVVRSWDVGLLAEVGADHVSVFRQPSAAVLPTGDELVDASEKPGPGMIRNSNGPMVVAMFEALGVKATDLGIGRDNEQSLLKLMEAGLQSDVLVLSGGVSAGMLDLVPKMLNQLNVKQVFHKVRVKPGKPIWFGVFDNGDSKQYVFGLPGNPVSSLVGFQLFVRAALRRLAGRPVIPARVLAAELAADHEVRGDRPTYWPGCWVAGAGVARRVRPLQWLGSSDLRTLGHAELLIKFPPGSQVHPTGSVVEVIPMHDF